MLVIQEGQEIAPLVFDNEFSKENLWILINKLNIKHPDIVMAQAQLESGFNSNRFIKYNNLFGMNHPTRRPTTSLGDYSFANYETWQLSVIDYALYQAYTCKNLNRDEYIEHLKNNYAQDSLYEEKIRKIANGYKNYKPTAGKIN